MSGNRYRGRERRSLSAIHWTGIAVATLSAPLVVVGLMARAPSDAVTPAPRPAERRAPAAVVTPAPPPDCRGETLWATITAQSAVKHALAPKPAAFNRRLTSLAEVGRCEWLIRAYVDTVNDFSAPVRRWWVVRVQYDEAAARWLRSDVVLGSERETLLALAGELGRRGALSVPLSLPRQPHP